MTKVSVKALVLHLMHTATDAGGGRAAETVHGGHEKSLRQTVIGMIKGTVLNECGNQDDETVYVLEGHIQMHVGDDVWEARAGTLLIVPHELHRFEALEDSAVLMSVAKRPYPPGQILND